MGADNSNYGQLKDQLQGLVWQHIVLDGQDRPSEIYTAPRGAENGTACTKVTYKYKDATSAVVVAMKEENAVWDSSFDPAFFT